MGPVSVGVAALLMTVAASLGGQDTGAAEWRMTRLDLDVTVERATAALRLTGSARIVANRPATRLAMGVNSRKAVMQFDHLEAVGARATMPVAGPDALRVATLSFGSTVAAGDTVTVTFGVHSTDSSSQLVVQDAIALASWVEMWYPAPLSDDGSLSVSAISAPGQTTFHLPTGWRSVSNGKLASSTDANAGAVETWDVSVPVARSFAAARYTVGKESFAGRDIAVYLLSASPSSATSQARVLANAISALERRFGPYPTGGYAIAEIPEQSVGFSASSEQGFILAKSSIVSAPGGNLPLFAHEAAHAWWGNRVASTGAGAQLASESLAQYGAVIAIEALEGPAAAADFLRFSRAGYNPLQCAAGYFYIWNQGGDKALAQLGNGRWDHDLSDAKGHWVYHMLRQRVGDSVFFATLRALDAAFAGRAMTAVDIREAFIAHAPSAAKLEIFFAQWLDRPGAPVLDVDWTVTRYGRGMQLVVKQRQGGAPYVFALDIAITLRDGSTIRRTLDIRERDQSTEFNLPGWPVAVAFDPDAHLLMWRPEYGPRPEK